MVIALNGVHLLAAVVYVFAVQFAAASTSLHQRNCASWYCGDYAFMTDMTS